MKYTLVTVFAFLLTGHNGIQARVLKAEPEPEPGLLGLDLPINIGVGNKLPSSNFVFRFIRYCCSENFDPFFRRTRKKKLKNPFFFLWKGKSNFVKM